MLASNKLDIHAYPKSAMEHPLGTTKCLGYPSSVIRIYTRNVELGNVGLT